MADALFFPEGMVGVFTRIADDMTSVHGQPYQRSEVPSEWGSDSRMRVCWLDEADQNRPLGWLLKGRGFRIQFDMCWWFLDVWGWGEDTERLICPEADVETTLRGLLKLDEQQNGGDR